MRPRRRCLGCGSECQEPSSRRADSVVRYPAHRAGMDKQEGKDRIQLTSGDKWNTFGGRVGASADSGEKLR